MKKKNPKHLLIGERKGLPPEGFDYGNSPAEMSKLNLTGKIIILTTSAGSQAIVNAQNASEILIGSFANVEAVSGYIKQAGPEQVALIACGYRGTGKALEDECCAHLIKNNLTGNKTDFKKMKDEILESERAGQMRELMQRGDIEFALKLNSHNLIPKYDFKKRVLHG